MSSNIFLCGLLDVNFGAWSFPRRKSGLSLFKASNNLSMFARTFAVTTASEGSVPGKKMV